MRSPAVTAAAAAVTAAAAAAAAAAAVIAAIVGAVDAQGATVELGSVHGLEGALRVLAVLVRHETETAAAARLAIGDDLGLDDRSVLLECGAKARVIRIPTKTTNKKLLRHVLSLSGALTMGARCGHQRFHAASTGVAQIATD